MFVKNGMTMDYQNLSPSDGIPYLTPVVVDELVGIALSDIAPGAVGSLAVEGVFQLPAETTATFTVGQTLYWDSSEGKLTATQGSFKKIGYAFAAKESSGATGLVKLGW